MFRDEVSDGRKWSNFQLIFSFIIEKVYIKEMMVKVMSRCTDIKHIKPLAITAKILQVCACVLVMSSSLQPHGLACQIPLSMGISRQEYWSGLTFPPPEDLPDLGIEPASPALAGICFTTESPGKPLWYFRGLLMLHSGGNRGKRLGFRDRRLGLHPALPRIRFKSLFLTLGEVT